MVLLKQRWRAHWRRWQKGGRHVWFNRWQAATVRLWAWFGRTQPSKAALLRMERHHARLISLCARRPYRVEWSNVLKGMASVVGAGRS